jgi:DNA modification methylase
MRQTKPSEHVPFPRPVDALGPGARRLARKSANRLSDAAISRQVAKLGKLIRDERDAKLTQGDLLKVLIERHQLRPVDLARELKCRANHLSEMYWVAKTFEPRMRRPHIPYTHYWMAMRTVRKFRQLKLSPMAVLREIARHGYTQHRDVTRHFAAKLRQQENASSLRRSPAASASRPFDRCYHAPFQSLLNVFPPASIKVIWADPPYSNYRRLKDGRYAGGSITSTGCDNETAAEAVAVTVDLLKDWGPKLQPGGIVLLWQAVGLLRKPIVDAVEHYGWEIDATVIWDKGNLAPGNFESAYSTQTEWCWAIKRRGDRLLNHDNSSRSDIVRFDPAFRTNGHVGYDHAFMKPDALCGHFLGKHCYEGELVFEPYGCTGSFCLAAAKSNRRWVYAESHAANFALGCARLNALTQAPAKVAG